MQTNTIQTSWGTIRLTLKGKAVIDCTLPFLKTAPRRPFVIKGFHTLEDLLRKFPGIGNPAGTEFQRAVWNELKKIPRGEVRTYGDIAVSIGNPRAARAVGSACGANPLPLFIPCHRAVAKNGPGGFGSGLPWKRLLLEAEGWTEKR